MYMSVNTNTRARARVRLSFLPSRSSAFSNSLRSRNTRVTAWCKRHAPPCALIRTSLPFLLSSLRRSRRGRPVLSCHRFLTQLCDLPSTSRRENLLLRLDHSPSADDNAILVVTFVADGQKSRAPTLPQQLFIC